MASLSALILDETAGRLRASFSMALSPDGVGWQGPVLAAAGALQAEEVRRLIEGGFAQALGGEVDGPARPPSKPRETPDAADWWAHLNAISADPEMPEFGDELFWCISRLQLQWGRVRLEKGLLKALIPCLGEPGHALRTGQEPPGLVLEPEECSVLSLATARHPRLGAGLLIRTYPPFPVDGESAARLAHELNVWEAYEIPTFLGLGAWCADPDRSRVVHVAFLPAAFQSRPDLLMALIVDEPERSAWFGGLLGDDVPAN
jgi:hypothetical protein